MVEPRIPTTEGLRKPDLVALTSRGAVVPDTTIVADACIATMVAAFKSKMDYYDKEDIKAWIGGRWSTEPANSLERWS